MVPLVPLVILTSKWYQDLKQDRTGTAEAVHKLLTADGVLSTSDEVSALLLATFGDLHQVWEEHIRSQALLALPLPALELLLASDALRIGSEDIVLYTAEKYVKHHQLEGDDAKRLAALVRVPGLSRFCLSSQVLYQSHSQLLLPR